MAGPAKANGVAVDAPIPTRTHPMTLPGWPGVPAVHVVAEFYDRADLLRLRGLVGLVVHETPGGDLVVYRFFRETATTAVSPAPGVHLARFDRPGPGRRGAGPDA